MIYRRCETSSFFSSTHSSSALGTSFRQGLLNTPARTPEAARAASNIFSSGLRRSRHYGLPTNSGVVTRTRGANRKLDFGQVSDDMEPEM